MTDRIYLSSPHMGGSEQELVADAFASNWIAPLGPHVDAFERELADRCGVASAAALASGTAGLHLALRLVGIGSGDEVICPTLTFVASVNPVLYMGARPVFIDVDPDIWTLDPSLLEEELEHRSRQGVLPAAVVAVDLYGQCADYGRIEAICREFEVPLIEDAAEALGSGAYGRPAGSFGDFGVLSFNGNKIITTSRGGALVSNDSEAITRARHLASQAREPAPHYEHTEVGYNYRLSNILAAIGRGQLQSLDERVKARRAIFDRYVEGLGDIGGVEFMPEADYGTSNRWLTTLTIDPGATGRTRENVRLALEEQNIESRPLWKPMHMQPVFEGVETIGGGVSEALFADGLCLPSGSSLTEVQQDRVIGIVREVLAG